MTKRKRGQAPKDYKMKRVVVARSALKSFNESCRRPQPAVSTAAVSAPSVAPSDIGAATSVAIAQLLSGVSETLADKYQRDDVADFLLRCAFTCFLASVDLLPAKAFPWAVNDGTLALLWLAMVGELQLPRTGIFREPTSLELDGTASVALTELAAQDWRKADLSIFGTLVEGSLDAKRRHSLGAHYTPREYVLRLVQPTIEEPLREEFARARETASVLAFHKKLCATRVLDPACGTGNFLIVALETLYAIEDDVLREIDVLGLPRPDERVTPHQMHGIELNSRACEVCKLVLNMCDLRRRHATGSQWISI